MKYLLVSCLFLTGCSTTVPVVMKFPEVPAELAQSCEELEKLPIDTRQLSITAETIIRNYGRYHRCSNQVEAWKEWHRVQKQIYKSVK